AQKGFLLLSAFYIRRSFRIFPLYYVTLAAYCFLILILGLNPEKRPMLLGALPYYLLYMQEVPFFGGINGETSNIPFYQSWSLGIEEKFYLVWPLLAFVVWRGRTSLRYAETLLLVVAFALAPLLSLVSWDLGALDSCLYPYYHILIGCFLALLLNDRKWFE